MFNFDGHFQKINTNMFIWSVTNKKNKNKNHSKSYL